MNKRLFKKAFRDLFGEKRKTIVAITAIMLGMIAFGTLLFSYEMITNELVTTYSSIVPSSASINVDHIDEKFIDLTNEFPEITDYEIKAYYKMRGQTENGEWTTLEMFASDDYSNLKMNKVYHIDGTINPGLDEMLIERDAMTVAGKGLGDTMLVTLPNGSEKELTITGVINDLGVHPATMHNTIYAYVSKETLQTMGLSQNRIDVITKGDAYDRQTILTISNTYMRMLESNGYQIKKLDVENTPGVSMHLAEYKTALFMLRTFAFVAFLFGCLIMSSLITSIMSRQIKQIGILKSFGTKSIHITITYICALAFFIIAIGIACLPLSKLLANIVSAPLLRLSNMTLIHTQVSPLLFIVFFCTCMIVPPVVAYFSIRKGTRVTIKEAINYSGIPTKCTPTIFLKGFQWLQRPVLLTLRNALRRKGRFALNVITLAISGTCFISVLVSMISVQSTLNSNMNTFGYDYRFSVGNTEKGLVSNILNNIAEIDHLEYWSLTSGKFLYQDGEVGNNFPIIAIPEDSKLVTPELLDGRWLEQNDTNAIVVGHKFLESHQDIDTGDFISMDVAGRILEFHIVGVLKDFSGTNIYMTEQFYMQNIPLESSQCMLQVQLDSSLKGKTQEKLIQEIEESILNQGVSILQSETKADAIKILNSHYMTTFQTFLIVIFMILIVSSFGLASTTNIQTLERTKEIGILKSIGADKKKIIKIITSESVFVSSCGFTLSAILAIPGIIISLAYFSKNTLKTPIQCSGVAVIISYIIWLFLTLMIGKISSKRSALHAANMTIKDSL